MDEDEDDDDEEEEKGKKGVSRLQNEYICNFSKRHIEKLFPFGTFSVGQGKEF